MLPLERYKIFKPILFLLLVFHIAFLSHGLHAIETQNVWNRYASRTWSVKSGLPQNTINTLLQTHDGYIWIGTPSGLTRFDGVNFIVFDTGNTPALKSNHISVLFEDHNGVLWIGTDGGGLTSFDKGEWKTYSSNNGLSNNYIRAIINDWSGNLWIGTEYGLNRLFGDDIQVFTTKDGLYDNIITALTIDNRGDLWIGTLQGGLVQFNEEIIHVYNYYDGLLNDAVISLTTGHMGNIWIGTLEGLYSLQPKEGTIIHISGTGYTPITSIIEDDGGVLWLGTMADGLKQRVDGILHSYTLENGLPDDWVRTILKDNQGTIWIGLDGGGLIQFKKSGIKNITRKHGLPENNTTTVLQDRKGVLWLGTRYSGICKMMNNQIIEVLNKDAGLSDDRIKVIFEDSRGSIYVGTESGGINIIEKNNIRVKSSREGLCSNRITAVLQDKVGTIWIGSDKGLNKVIGTETYEISKKLYLKNEYIRCLLESRTGDHFIGTKTGIYHIKDDACIRLTGQKDSNQYDVMALYEAQDGALWIGTNGNGLKRWFEEKMTSYSTREGLYDNYVFSLTEDQYGNLWMSSHKGVFKVNAEKLVNFSEPTFCTYYDESDGMISRQCNGGNQPAVFCDKGGKLYYPTIMGIAIFDPTQMPENSTPPKCIIEQVFVDGQKVSHEDLNILPYGFNLLEVYFTAFDYFAPEKLKFKYKLEGYEDQYHIISANDKRVAQYLNLAPRMYRFTLNAIDNQGSWDKKGLSFEFKISAPFYHKPFFYAITVVGFLLFMATAYLIQRYGKIKKQLLKYKTSTLASDRVQELIPKLLKLMQEDELFLDPDLRLRDLARRVGVPYNHLSQIINNNFGLCYNDFINKYRINAAKEKLVDSEFKDKTILEIMYETGFYSKSVFNTAFKKFTGMTPKEYRKQHA